MSILWSDSHFSGSNVVYADFPGPDRELRRNRESFDAVAEVPHRFDKPDRFVVGACVGAVVAVALMALWGWL